METGLTILVSRRLALAGSLLAVPALASLPAAAQPGGDAAARLAELERAHGGRLGVAALNLATGGRIGYRADERFLLCSTFKALAAAFVLARVDRKQERLDRRIVFSRKDLVAGVSSVTQRRVGGAGMTVAELCDATVTYSDNTAGNLLLASFGGPAGLTAFLRSLGDEVTRLDRIETELNAYAGPGDPSDTTTPAAMLETLRKLLFGDALSASSRHQLAAWLITNKTGDARLRAGFPAGWLVGDKTGTGGNPEGSTNDVAVAWPSDRGPIIVTAYCELPSQNFEQRNPVVAEIGRIVSQV